MKIAIKSGDETMISRLILRLQDDDTDRLDYSVSSSLQGVLMQYVDPSYGEFLHQSGMHPYSQYLNKKKKEFAWVITALNGKAAEELLEKVTLQPGDGISLKYRQKKIEVLGREREDISYDELMQKNYFRENKRFIRIRFLTPVAFKQAGNYCIFPSPRLIFQSLMLKYDACAENSRILDEEVLAHYEEYSKIVRYNLKSTCFPLEGVRIPAFTGELTIRVGGPAQMVNLAWLLAAFGEYSGVGIKTSMGMGAMKIVEKEGKI